MYYFGLISRAKWRRIHGTKYKVGALVYTGYTGTLPKFSIIKSITVTNPRNREGYLFFIVKEITFLEYDSHTHFYKDSRVEEEPPRVLKQSAFVTFLPMTMCNPIGVEGVTCLSKNMTLMFTMSKFIYVLYLYSWGQIPDQAVLCMGTQ